MFKVPIFSILSVNSRSFNFPSLTRMCVTNRKQLQATMRPTFVILLWCILLIHIYNGKTCTTPIYNNSAGAIIRGPCPSSTVIAPIGSTIKFNCSYDYTGDTLTFWNVTDIGTIVGVNSPKNTNIHIKLSGGSGNGFTTLSLPVTQYEPLDVQCGLCNGIDCYLTPLQVTVISLPVQLISFGK